MKLMSHPWTVGNVANHFDETEEDIFPWRGSQALHAYGYAVNVYLASHTLYKNFPGHAYVFTAYVHCVYSQLTLCGLVDSTSVTD